MDQIYITKDELEVERSPAELAAWAKAKFEEIADLPGGTDAIRFRKGLCKVLGEEVYALSIWATQRFGNDPNIRLQPVVGNQSFDALVKDYSSNPPKIHYVEITQAHPGESEHLRMLLLKENGWAWAHAKLQKSGSKKTGITVSVGRALHTHSEIVSGTLQLIRQAVSRKAQKTYAPDTELLVMFEDGTTVRDVIESELAKYCADDIGKLNLSFRCVHFVGWFQGIYASWKPEPPHP